MVNVFPAESTRSASIWSSRVSTPSTGITTVRMVGIVTVMYIAVAKTNAAVKVRVFVFPKKKEKECSIQCVRGERVHPPSLRLR